MKALSGRDHPVIVDGRNVIDPDAFIGAGFAYRGIGRGDRNRHPLRRAYWRKPVLRYPFGRGPVW